MPKKLKFQFFCGLRQTQRPETETEVFRCDLTKAAVNIICFGRFI